ncbi:hypothetical protein OIDMADRAFT_166048 [Oidiodendron maius Zn]|uniref:Heterokaryon incompatibility domain-containing protein n=1 Tax=Oidiodendron maius (strain Zn) TaxID=913774 RepID=A0A0C3HC20_OIDMZ|nr:hypothetical protein OIDMADRAFT_166048 [Oidiodendron maius Zn]
MVPFVEEADRVKQSSTASFTYSPLDHSIDSIRLLILQPAEDPSALICCKLQDATFAERPKYEALSYTWGSETARQTISINGQQFDVGRNLFDALQHLRDPLEERSLWVDAICINQSNVPEKSHQISIMPFIYIRARTVLVWLGVPENSAANQRNWEMTFGKVSDVVASDQNDILLHTLCENPYWRRVWIVQEVGLAKRRLVHFGAYKVDWDTFIQKIKSKSQFKKSLPLRMQDQIDAKFENGHKLQSLIESHRDSQCKERGYTGPVIDTLHFGRIVQELLGGPKIATAEQLAGDISPAFNLAQDSSRLQRTKIWLPALVVGKIVHLGPTYQEIMSSLKDVASWRASINYHLRERNQPSAREESELFLELLEDITEKDLEIVFSFDREIICAKPYTPNCMLEADGMSMLTADQYAKLAEMGNPTPTTTLTTIKGPRLFLLGGVRDLGSKSNGQLGLAPDNAAVGDYIFLIDGIEKAIIVRQVDGGVKVVGTGCLAENRFVARAATNGGMRKAKIFGTADIKYIDQRDRLDLFVDLATVYQLIS